MIPATLTVLAGMVILLKSADMFVDGASSAARHFGMPALLIGMVVVGFGTSAPELLVSSFAAFDGNPGIALGNAYGSNIANIGLILGTAALVSPISVHSLVLKKELPVLTAVTALAAFHLRDGILGRGESFFLLVLFLILTVWALHQGLHRKNDALGREMDRELKEHRMTRRKSVLLVIAGLLLLVASSRLVVWGAVVVARGLGVSDLVIGLTIVAVGTSLPELASSISAARKGEHDLALGNVLGSNLFNTLAVAGIAGAIRPLKAGREIFYRDMPVMALMTVSLFILGYGFRSRAGRINRWEAAFLLASYTVYTLFVISPGFAVR